MEKPPATAKYLVLFWIAVVGAALSIFYLAASFQYPIGNLKQPGPALYPLAVGVFFLIASIGTVLGVRSQKGQGYILWPMSARLWRMMIIIGGIIVYILCLTYIGHALSAALVILITLKAVGEMRWPMKIALSAGIGLGSFYLFDFLLGTPLPRGIWFE